MEQKYIILIILTIIVITVVGIGIAILVKNKSSTQSIQSSHYTMNTATNIAPLKGAVKKFDNIGITVTDNIVTFPAGTSGMFLCCFIWYGTSTVTKVPTVNLKNLTGTAIMITDSTGKELTSWITNTNTNSYNLILIQQVIILNSSIPSTMTFAGDGILPVSVNSADMIFTKLNSSLK